MRFRVLRVRNLICVSCLALLFVMLWKTNSGPRLPHSPFFFGKTGSSDPFTHVTVTGDWFPDFQQRVRIGAADTWRDPHGNNSASAVTGLGGDYKDLVDPLAFKTFYMLKTGANVMWERLPVHFSTTLKRFPFHQIYSDESAIIGKEHVVDCLEDLPQSLLDDYQLVGYRVREQNVKNNWGWDTKKIRLETDHEGWQSDKFKNIPMLLHAYRNAPKHCDWFVFADDDSYIMSHSLGSMLRKLDPRKPYYLGSPALIEVPFSNTGKVGAAMKAGLPENRNVQLWFAHGGSGIIISRGTLEALFWDPQREDDLVARYSRMAIHQCCGDAMVAYILREELELFLNRGVDETEFYNDPFQGNALADTSIWAPAGGWCQRIMSWHHLKPWEISKLFDWETSLLARKPNLDRGVLSSDVYHDFILPYLLPERENWDIYATFGPYGPEDTYEIESTGETLWPGKSKEHCKRMCEARTFCLGWTYSTGKCMVQQDGIVRGEAWNDRSQDWTSDSEPIISGWDIEKIRKIRSGEECDGLEYNTGTGEYNDSPNTSEGWYFRSLELEQQSESSAATPGFEQALAQGKDTGSGVIQSVEASPASAASS